jgi:hypothetical protein
MDTTTAIAVVSALANGIDHRTGEVFARDSPYQSADVIRALYIAVRELEHVVRGKRGQPTRTLPINAGKPWNEEDDRLLLERWDQGNTIELFGEMHGRTLAGIRARLERHGRLSRPGPRVGGGGRYLPSNAPDGPHQAPGERVEEGK